MARVDCTDIVRLSQSAAIELITSTLGAYEGKIRAGEEALETGGQLWGYARRLLDREATNLVREWQRIESHLFRHHGWPGLSEAEQLRLPVAEPLFAIDRLLAIVDAQRDALLPAIHRTAACDFADVEAKLEVLERIIYREDHPEAHALIRSTRRDVAKLRF